MKPIPSPFARLAGLAAVLCLLAFPQVSLAGQDSGTAIVLAVFGSESAKAHAAYAAMFEAVKQAHPEARVELAHTARTLHAPLPATAHPYEAATPVSPAAPDAQIVSSPPGSPKSENAPSSPDVVIDRLAASGAKRICVQSLLVLAGQEFAGLSASVEAAKKRHPGVRIALGAPLLAKSADVTEVADAFFASAPAGRGPGDALLAVVHGTKSQAGALYAELAKALSSRDGLTRLAAIEGEPSFDAALADLSYSAPSKIFLIPLLAVAGNHVSSDVAGPGPDSFTNRLRQAGMTPVVVDSGLLEQPAFAAMWQRRLDAALTSLGHD